MAVDVLFVEMRYGGVCGTSAFTAGICSILDGMGLTYAGVDGMDTDALDKAIAEMSPRLVLSCPRFKSVCMFPLVSKYPKVKFGYRTLSNANMMAYHQEWPLLCAWVDIMRSHPNTFCLPNNEETCALFSSMSPRVMLFPNVYMHTFDMMKKRDTDTEIRIGVAGRPCYSKNFAVSAIALMALGNQMPIHVFVWSAPQAPPHLSAHTECFAQLGTRVTYMPWTHDFRDMIRGVDIDLGFCASTTESFGYVPLDFLSLGLPVVGSTAIRFLPRKWQATDEGDPVEMCHTIMRCLSEYGESRKTARTAFKNVTSRNRAIACKTIESVLS